MDLVHEVRYSPEAVAVSMLIGDKRSAETRKAYRQDLEHFFGWTGRECEAESVRWLCSHDAAGLSFLLHEYKGTLLDTCSVSTVNRRLSSLRSLLRMARRLGAAVPDPSGLVSSEKAEAYRDTRGAGMDDAAKMLAACDLSTVRGLRDYALLRLMVSTGLRRAEALLLDVQHLDQATSRLWIIAKGKTERQAVTVPFPAMTAILDYLQARRDSGEELQASSPLWLNDSPVARFRGRLSLRGCNIALERMSLQALGRRINPHALRHLAITTALDATNGDIRTVQRFSRHADVRVVQRYDDNRKDLAGEAARKVSEALEGALGGYIA